MKHFISITLCIIASLNYQLYAQQISSEAYNNNYINEDFNEKGELFKVMTTTENYFIIDKGDYLLSRNNNESEYAIIANNSNVSDFVLKTTIRIGPSENKKASLGIILKAQQDGKGAIIFEINKKREYRVKKLVNNTYDALSGKKKNNGWVKSKFINGVDEHNFIEIRSERNIYEVYVNNEYLTRFFIPDFNNGSCGLIITPATKARVSYYYVNTKGNNEIITEDNQDNNTQSINSTVETLNKRIENLEKNNQQLNELNSSTKELQEKEIIRLKKLLEGFENSLNYKYHEADSLKTVIAKLETNNKKTVQELNISNKKLSNTISNHNKEIKELKSEIESSKKTSETEIKELKSEIESSKKTLKDATAINNQLNKEINKLNETITVEKSEKKQIKKELNELDKSSKIKITKIKNEITSLEKKIKTLESKNSTLTATLESERNNHKESITKLSQSINNKIDELRASKSDFKKLDKLFKETNIELNKLQKTQKKHDEIVDKLKAEISALNNTINTLENTLKTVNNKNAKLESRNNELNDLFILKDFEINGIKPSELLTKQNSKSNKEEPKELIGNKTVYSVQLGSYMQKIADELTKGFDNIWFKTTKQGTYIYYSGEFSSPQEATSHMYDLISQGYSNIFITTVTK